MQDLFFDVLIQKYVVSVSLFPQDFNTVQLLEPEKRGIILGLEVPVDLAWSENTVKTKQHGRISLSPRNPFRGSHHKSC